MIKSAIIRKKITLESCKLSWNCKSRILQLIN